ncbi:sulfotransferase domain-containing protein [Phenylobacterium deserti]|uniref:Sulfotransferase n=1 Tax=Phenylobacterium deserti TaxID=1914756 RepID=A0A328AUC4_9CAUL|nr:sulfotransferase domain-containing protein [Phenylobacterium deserti]RAK57875.1 sulfotransferase [Phenylobacterium deserti]
MSEDPRVSFIIIGVQKGGTTALFDYLSDQPDLALSRVKEVHFFDDEARAWERPDYTDYHAQFPPYDGRPRGEATPIYLYWPSSLERIRAYNPAAKLIVLLRDPVQRAWSHWRMEYARGAETEPFAWCIRDGRQRLFASAPWGHHREFSYVERGFYAEQLERLFSLFPREQVLIRQSEQLRSDPASILGDVRRFLGLREAPAPQPREVHVGRKMNYPSTLTPEDVAHLREVYRADQLRLRALLEDE